MTVEKTFVNFTTSGTEELTKITRGQNRTATNQNKKKEFCCSYIYIYIYIFIRKKLCYIFIAIRIQ